MDPLQLGREEPKAAEPSPMFLQKDVESMTPTEREDAAVFHFSQAQAYSLDNETLKAIESYKTTLIYDPKSALVRARLASELQRVGSYAEAKALCEAAIKIDPKYVDSYLLLAGIHVAAKEYKESLSTYEKVLSVDPKNRDALLYYGVTLAEVGRTKEAIAQVLKLTQLKDTEDSNIDRSVSYYYLAKIYEQENRKDSAIDALEKALEVRPGFSKAALALADIYQEKKNPKKVQETLENAFAENRRADLAERLADIFLEKGEYKKAVVYLETLVEEDSTNENMKLRLALVYWQVQWRDKAKNLLENLHAHYPASSEILFYLGEIEMELNHFKEALAYYEEISKDYVKYDQVVGRVAQFYRTQKQFAKAEDYLQNSIQKRPDMVAFYPLLAAVYEDSNRMVEAKLALERGLKLFPLDESILYYLGFIYERVGEKEQSFSTMQKLLTLNPNNANALNFVGYTLLEHGDDPKSAQPFLEKAVALKPDDAFVLDSYGWLLYRLGKANDALKVLERALAYKPDESVISEHLADIYVALKMPEKAMAMYEKALHANPDQELANRVQNKLANVRNAVDEPINDSVVYRPKKLRRPASR